LWIFRKGWNPEERAKSCDHDLIWMSRRAHSLSRRVGRLTSVVLVNSAVDAAAMPFPFPQGMAERSENRFPIVPVISTVPSEA